MPYRISQVHYYTVKVGRISALVTIAVREGIAAEKYGDSCVVGELLTESKEILEPAK